MSNDFLQNLPAEVLDRASKGNEYAWRISDIPAVIKAAQDAGLVSVGGQLQFRIPDEGTCECWWVQVDTYPDVPKTLPWSERVERSASSANAKFGSLQIEDDFIAEGRKAFGEYLSNHEKRGGQVEEVMWFVWYLVGPADGH